MEPLVLLLVFSVHIVFTDGFEVKLDADSTEPDSPRSLCCLLYNAQAQCGSLCQGKSCSDSCRTSCGVMSSQCGTWSCGSVTSQCQETTGSLIMVGGNLQEDNTEIWNRLVAAAGGPGARICLINAANANPVTSGEYYVDLFTRYQASPVWVPVTESDPASASDQTNVDTIMGCDGVFLGGGEPWRLARTLRLTEGNQQVDSPVLTAIKAKLNSGGFLGGTSAGIMALSDAVVISGGYSWEALTYGPSVGYEYTQNLTYDPLGGLGVLQNVMIDAHFSDRGRQGRLTRLLAHTSTERAFGVDEDTALDCEYNGGDLDCGVLGTRGVWLLDTPFTCPDTTGYWSCRGLLTSYLTHSDRLKMTSTGWTTEFAAWKTTIVEDAGLTPTWSGDIFNSERLYEYQGVVSSLLSSTQTASGGSTNQTAPVSYQAVFFKIPQTEAVRGELAGVEKISYKHLLLDFAQYCQPSGSQCYDGNNFVAPSCCSGLCLPSFSPTGIPLPSNCP